MTTPRPRAPKAAPPRGSRRGAIPLQISPQKKATESSPRKPVPPRFPGKKPPTEAEREAAREVREARAAARRDEVAAIRAVDPACELEGEAVHWRVPARIAATSPAGELANWPRVSGRGLPGSKLTLCARAYDGTGPNGGEAREYVTAFVMFHDLAGHPRRSIGCAIRREELRDVARALVAHADALEGKASAAP
jgi:hypothetical protein